MKEQLKIIVDEKRHTHVWVNGIKQKYITNLCFEVRPNSAYIPHLILERDFLQNRDLERDLENVIQKIQNL